MVHDGTWQTDEQHIEYVAKVYNSVHLSTLGQKAWVYSRTISAAKRLTQRQYLQRIIQMAEDLRATPEVFIRAQFEMLRNTKFQPQLCHVASEKSVLRFKEYIRRTTARNKGIGQTAALSDAYSKALFDVIYESAEILYRRLVRMSAMMPSWSERPVEIAMRELEMLLRCGKVRSVYLTVSPLVRDHSNLMTDYIREECLAAEKHLSADEKQQAAERHMTAISSLPLFAEKGIAQYVIKEFAA